MMFIKFTERQNAEVERLRRYYRTADISTIRYHVMTDAQRAVYWINRTLIVAGAIGLSVGALILALLAL
jgi:hypothetical protein